VAQRRLLWRWTLWYIQRLYVPVLVALALIFAAVHFSDRWFVWPLAAGTQIAAPPVVVPEPPVATPVPLPEQLAPMETAGWTGEPITLHAAHQLGAQTSSTSSTTAAPALRGQTDTLPLKPETWLHSKEP
jgi:hypothetical protein